MTPTTSAWKEFHVSHQARDLYQFDQDLFSTNGNVIIANFHAARVFAQKLNARRDLVNFPERSIQAGQVNALGLIDEILHLVIAQYRKEVNPAIMSDALAWLEAQLGEEAIQQALSQFINLFPPLAVYRREISAAEYLSGSSSDEDGRPVSHREIALEELLMLWLANQNPAFSPFYELFDDETLERESVYRQLVSSLVEYIEGEQPAFLEGQSLIAILRSPAINAPYSLEAQLAFLQAKVGARLGSFIYRLLRSMDLIKEEQKIVIGFGGGGPAQVVEFRGQEIEPENYSPDQDWMPNLVLLAKNSYVWLDQLSKQYQRAITRLDQIPDEELDRLANGGFTSLWLIGLWERSMASKTIKQLRGNPEAVASAYSLFSYEIAADLGGEEAYQSLRERAWQRGIRLASDMVPNHMGIDSRWVVEHPDWFVSLPDSPFPGYSFNGPNFSWDNRVGIYLEDHYYNNTDAAVVFKRVDFWTGSVQYIYHGNDGTAMPWNDTAQLNYLKPEVREAVIQTILHVARKFPVIRFDAAMTLAKRHYHRLWYPEPGSGGDIPSRSEHGLTRDQFDAAIPVEFWREVVDRVAQEAPDTLLLAEAFWLMEGYFVRTLGMHRVYNSAFMNMLRDEKNQEYRLVIKNTLEFDPEILQRYVNFMNNPDERTAVDQFGKGDKYFGICTLLATLPGTPMFGHGQLEGFTEKYGMEYRRAYWDEKPDGYLLQRHAREIYPILRKRYLFAQAKQFFLYDFYGSDGMVNEDVYAYSNRTGEERALVVFHNRYATARGWIRVSAAYPLKTGMGDERILVQKTLGEGLSLPDDGNSYVIFQEQATGMEYLRNCQELQREGLYIELGAYQLHVFLEFRIVPDTPNGQYRQLTAYLNGRGVPSISQALKEVLYQPVLQAYRQVVNAEILTYLFPSEGIEAGSPIVSEEQEQLSEKLLALYAQVKEFSQGSGREQQVLESTLSALGAAGNMPALVELLEDSSDPAETRMAAYLQQILHLDQPGGPATRLAWACLYGWCFTARLGELVDENMDQTSAWDISRSWMDEWLLGKSLQTAFIDLGASPSDAERSGDMVKLLISHSHWYAASRSDQPELQLIQDMLRDSLAQNFLSINRYQGILWYRKEAFEELVGWLFTTSMVHLLTYWSKPGQVLNVIPEELREEMKACFQVVQKLQAAQEVANFQVEKLISTIKGEAIRQE